MESENKPPEEPHPDEPRDNDASEFADQIGNAETASDGEEQDEGKTGEPHPDEPSE